MWPRRDFRLPLHEAPNHTDTRAPRAQTGMEAALESEKQRDREIREQNCSVQLK